MQSENELVYPAEKKNFIPVLIIVSLILFLGVGALATYNLFFAKKDKMSALRNAPEPTQGVIAQAPIPTAVIIPQTTTVPTLFPTQIPMPTTSLVPTIKPTTTPSSAAVAKPTLAITPTSVPTPSKTNITITATPQKSSLPDAGYETYTWLPLMLGIFLLASSMRLLKP